MNSSWPICSVVDAAMESCLMPNCVIKKLIIIILLDNVHIAFISLLYDSPIFHNVLSASESEERRISLPEARGRGEVSLALKNPIGVALMHPSVAKEEEEVHYKETLIHHLVTYR